MFGLHLNQNIDIHLVYIWVKRWFNLVNTWVKKSTLAGFILELADPLPPGGPPLLQRGHKIYHKPHQQDRDRTLKNPEAI